MKMELLELQYAEMVKALAKPGDQIIAEITPDLMHCLHMAVGVAGEAGELLDAVKKLAIYNKPLTKEGRDNLVEELGDLEFYMQGLRERTGITREEVLEANMAKLSKRYHAGKFTNTQAQERADKATA
jgi:NTP pyrophosphatase (non-canonical NTP hydrolase)